MDDTWRFEIVVRRIDLAVAASVLLHLVLFLLPAPQPKPVPPASASAPLQVVIANPRREPETEAQAVPPRPVERPEPRVVPRPAPLARSTPSPVPVPKVEPSPPRPAPEPEPRREAPAVDMMAAVEARRAARRSAENARSGPSGPPVEDAATRNLRTLTGGEGVGGVFEVLEKGVRTGRFAFNGWKPDSRNRWREVIEVDAGLGGDVEVAMVRRMIELIRTHYSGDFRWESHRLHRVVTLSARPEDQSGLEEFLVKEFFRGSGRG